MKSSDYARILVPASILMLAACDNTSNFAGQGNSGSGAGGGGGGIGGGSGGTTEPALAFGSDQNHDVAGILISGDGSKIVFVGDNDETGMNPDAEFQLFSYDINSGSLVQITDGSATALVSLWNFDITENGSSVVWASSDDTVAGSNPNNQTNIFKAATNGTGITQVTSIDAGFAIDPVMSGDGSVIVFRSETDLVPGSNPVNDMQVFAIDSDGSNLRQVTSQRLVPNALAISDDGSTIAFEGIGDPFGSNGDGSWEIFVTDIDGVNLTQVTASSGASFAPQISDDGSTVVFASRAEFVPGSNVDGNYELYTANTDGSSVQQITDSDRDSGNFEAGGAGSFDISGNGAFVVFGSDADLTGDNTDLEHTIFTAASDGSNIAQVLREGTIDSGAISRRADKPGMTNNGVGIVFASSVNLTSSAQPSGDKIYTTVRQ